MSSHPRGTWLYHSPVRLPPPTGFPRPAGVLALQEQVEHVHQQTGFPAHPVCTLRAASSPQNPSLPPATSTATSRKVGLCRPWARLQLAQPEPGTGPQEAPGSVSAFSPPNSATRESHCPSTRPIKSICP